MRHANLAVGEGGSGSGYVHVHDYVAAELGRLRRDGRAGGAVVASLGCLLIGIKGLLAAHPRDLLPLAELVSAQIHELPGLAR